MKAFLLSLAFLSVCSVFLSGCATTVDSGQEGSAGGISAPTDSRQDLYEMHNRTFRELGY